MEVKILIPLLILVMFVTNASAGFNDGLDVITPSVNITPAEPIDEPTPEEPTEEQEIDEYTKSDWLAGGFETGFENVLIKAADAIGSFWKNSLVKHKADENGKVIDEYGNVRGGIFVGVTENVEPDKIGPVAEFQQKTKSDWALAVLVFLFGYTFAAKIQKTKSEVFEHALGNYDFSESRYIISSMLAVGSYIAPKCVILYVEIISYLSQRFMLPVMDYIEPSAENAFMYFFMTIGETLVGGGFLIRQWVITAAYAVASFLLLAYVYGWQREKLKELFTWTRKIIDLQLIAVATSSFCLIHIKWFNLENVGAPYLLMFLFIAYVMKNYLVGGKLDKTVRHLFYGVVLKR